MTVIGQFLSALVSEFHGDFFDASPLILIHYRVYGIRNMIGVSVVFGAEISGGKSRFIPFIIYRANVDVKVIESATYRIVHRYQVMFRIISSDAIGTVVVSLYLGYIVVLKYHPIER